MDLTGKLKQRMVGKRRPIALLMLVSGTFANYAKTLDLPNLTRFSDETSGIFEPALENAKRLNQLFENQSPTNRLKTRSAKPLMMAWLEDSIQRWSQQFGISEVTLGGSRVHRLLSDGSLAWLHPWSQTDRRLLFTQFDFDYRIHQATFNIGAGYRWFNGTQGTWSSNLFYDQLIQGWHRRLGIGFEYSRDYFAIAFNGYWPLSGWRTVASNEQAKPAPGVDIRLTGYLPNYPQLGVIFTGEHHRGHEVALFKESAKQRLSNPLAAGLGIEYTPVPLCRVSYHYKLAKAGVSEHRYQLALTYQFDRSLTQQLDPAAAVYARSLQHQPLRLVQRNHQLQLVYRADDQPTRESASPSDEAASPSDEAASPSDNGLQIQLPNQLQGRAGQWIKFDIKTSTPQLLKEYHLIWNGTLRPLIPEPELVPRSEVVMILLPQETGSYTLQLIAQNQQGVQVISNEIQVTAVSQPSDDSEESDSSSASSMTTEEEKRFQKNKEMINNLVKEVDKFLQEVKRSGRDDLRHRTVKINGKIAVLHEGTQDLKTIIEDLKDELKEIKKDLSEYNKNRNNNG